MYVKFFSNKKGGSSASINYLLNEREKEGTAKILKGDRNLTESIIKSISNKQKVTVGVLSFEEQNISATQKEELMQEFEKTLFPGLSENQYNILWVEHTDKNRLELNFVIPKIELTTQKALNPYFHKYDFARIEMFEDIYNIKYNLTSKKDPSKAQTILGSKKELHIFKDYQELDKQLHELVQNGDIKNREQMIELLESSNIKVTRASKDYMSIKLPESKKAKKFKGGIYNEQFTSIEELETISEETDRRIKEFQSRDTSRELEQTIKRLKEYNEQKAQRNREKYQLKNDRYTRAEQEPIQFKDLDNSNSINNDRNNPSRGTLGRVHPKISRADKVVNTKRDEIPTRERKVYKEQRATVQQRQDDSIYQDRGIDYDIRRRTLKRIRERAEVQQRAYAEARQTRVELHKSVTADTKELRAEFEQNSIELSREYATVAEQSRELIRGAKEVAQESESSVRLSNEINRTTTARERITNTVRNFIEGVKELGADIKNKFQSIIRQSEEATRTAKENIDYREQQSYSHSNGMRM
jgi:hypothetical protein